MSENPPREREQRGFGRDGISGLVSRDRGIRARLLPRDKAPSKDAKPAK